MKSVYTSAVPTALAIALVTTLSPGHSAAAGFEVGENTPRALARGGTGVVNTQDPSAVYFNPALLPRVKGHQILVSSNFLTLGVDFQRDDFVYEQGGRTFSQSFEAAQNQTKIFPAPFLAASFDVGPEDLALGVGLFGPPAFGNPCYGERESGECLPDAAGATRGMVTEADLLVAYLGVGAGYRFQLGEGRDLSLGLTAALAYMNTDFSVFVEANPGAPPPWTEDPDKEAFVQAKNLTDFAPTGIIGLAYTTGPMRLAASYRPPMKWKAKGDVEVDFPGPLLDIEPTLSSDTAFLETWHAGSLRVGWGLQGGQHPADPDLPRWDLEINGIWENWSVVDYFRLELEGDIELRGLDKDEDGHYPAQTLHPFYQAKGYRDAFSVRAGFSYGLTSWLSAHGGGFFETAAQPLEFTAADFISWDRYSGSLGATFHLPANLDLTLGYAFIHSPKREVAPGTGRVFNPIPMSQCQGPEFEHQACQRPGTPPGNPQNEGTWRAQFQILSAGLTWQY